MSWQTFRFIQLTKNIQEIPEKPDLFIRIWNQDPEFRKFEIRVFKKHL